MRELTRNQHGFLKTYKYVALGLQILCALATTATYIRILEQHQLQHIFLILPSLLFILLSIDRCIPLHDRYLMSILTGATTGFISGFISNVVVNDISVTEHVTKRNEIVIFLCTLEFLHLPVVLGTIMYMFCLLFSRLPPIRIVILCAALGTCCMAIFSISKVIIYDQDGSVTVEHWTSAIIFIVVFCLALIPSVRSNKQAWLLCVLGYISSVYWQTGFFDCLQWNWEMSWFPVPGFLTSLVALFMLDAVELHESGYTLNINRGKQVLVDSTDGTVESDDISTAISWHCIAYIVERTSLTFIMENRDRKIRTMKTDTWICCLGMLGVFVLHTSSRQISLSNRIVITLLGLLTYFCITVTNGQISNGYFIDTVFGIAFLSLSMTSDYVVVY